MPPRFSIAPPDEEETMSALPMAGGRPPATASGGDGAPGGQSSAGQSGIPDRPEPPEAPSYPRIDTSQRERPTADQDARNRQALTGLLGALGTAFADAGDDPTMLNIASGLTQGSGQQLRQRREELKRRQEAYKKFLTEAQRFNREMQQRETQADYERRLSAFEAQSEARQGALDRRAEAAQKRKGRQADRQAAQRDHERTMEQIQERAEQRRRTQRVENQNTGGDTSEPIRMDDLSVPTDPVEAERRLNMTETRLKQMRGNRDRFTYEERNDRGLMEERVDEEYRERLSRLEQYRQLLQDQVQSRQGAPGQEQGQQPRSARPGAAQPTRPQGARTQNTRSQNTRTQATPTPDTSRQRSTRGGPEGSSQRRKRGGGYVDELNSALQSQGRRAALTKIADDLEAGRITERQAAAYYQQVAPDSLLNQ